jgi:hypothetical protein
MRRLGARILAWGAVVARSTRCITLNIAEYMWCFCITLGVRTVAYRSRMAHFLNRGAHVGADLNREVPTADLLKTQI